MIINDSKLPDLPPPSSTSGVIGWLRINLFSTPLYSLLTLVVGYLLWATLIPAFQWVFIDSDSVTVKAETVTCKIKCEGVGQHEIYYHWKKY